MKKYPEYKVDMEAPNHESPERNLWFAVIERALKDYCFFFDKLMNTNGSRLIIYTDKDEDYQNVFTIKAIAELSRLRWFLFSREPEQFNLEYLAEQLYENGSGVAADIRKEASRQFKRHLEYAESLGRFQGVLYYIKESTGAYSHTAAAKTSRLKKKRHGIT
jgi:hypothetical protein